MGSRCGDHFKEESSSSEQTVDLDEDGDIIVVRRSSKSTFSIVLHIYRPPFSVIFSFILRTLLLLLTFVVR